MAIALVHKANAKAITGLPNSGAIATLTTSNGSSLLIAVSCDYIGAGSGMAGGGPTIVDSKSNTWHILTKYTCPDSFIQVTVWYAKNPTVGNGHTCTITGAYNCIFFTSWSGVDTTSPFDVENGTGSDSSPASQQTGSITPSVSGELLFVACCTNSSASSFTTDNSFTNGDSVDLSASVNEGGYWAYLIQGSAAAINPAVSFGAGSNHETITIKSFKPSSSVTPVNQTISDTITLSDSESINVEVPATFSDSISLSDGISLLDICDLIFADTLSLTDSLAGQQQLNYVFNDTISLVDSLLYNLRLLYLFNDTLTLTDSQLEHLIGILSQALSDSLNLLDGILADLNYAANVSDSLSLSDSLSTSTTNIAFLTETLSDVMILNDLLQTLLSNLLPLNTTVGDSLSLIDGLSLILQLNIIKSDTFTITDSLALYSIISRIVSDSLSLTDSIIRIAVINKYIDRLHGFLLNNMVMADSVQTHILGSNAYSDTVVLSDSTHLVLTIQLVLNDTMALADGPLSGLEDVLQLELLVGDLMSMSDSISTLMNTDSSDYLREYLDDSLTIQPISVPLSGSTTGPTTDSTYLRRYLNDVSD